jgi:hypothetical protein
MDTHGFGRARTSAGVFMNVLIAYDGYVYAEVAIAHLDRAGLPSDTEVRVPTQEGK